MTLLLLILQSIPWYLFPGSKNANKTQDLPAKEPEVVVAPVAVADTTKIVEGDFEAPIPDYFNEIPETIELSILLPLGTTGELNEGAADFYCGAAMAVRDLGNKGLKISLNTYDTKETTVGPYSLKRSDVIIGPIQSSDIMDVMKRCPEDKYIVSPLDPRAAGLCETQRIIQAPSDAESQVLDLVSWVKEEYREGDRVFVICEGDNKALSANSKKMIQALDATGIDYKPEFDFARFDDVELMDAFGNTVGTDRYLIASENEAFIGTAVRIVSIFAMRKFGVALYCPSRVRSLDNVKTEHLHTSNMRVSASYQIDYSSPEVKNFIHSYRAFFNAEPNSFAFHGYDTVSYFVSLCSTYGTNWNKHLDAYKWKGLQTNFRFNPSEKVGNTNVATRRVIYNPDYTITTIGEL